MKKSALSIFAIALVAASATFYWSVKDGNPRELVENSGTEIGTADDPLARLNFEKARLVDPKTGEIPNNIERMEAQFASTISKNGAIGSLKKADEWKQRGPHNIGGRTRALAIDINDPNHLVAGGISGGIYTSKDGGKTWVKATAPNQLHSVTDIIQDTRDGKTNNWYFCTGEVYGNSADYPGDGIFKSTDNGATWVGLQEEGKPQEFRHLNYSWRMVMDHTRNDSDIMYLASFGAILRSNDGGLNWNIVKGGTTTQLARTGADIAISPKGVLWATLSSNTPNNGGGLWRSTNGLNWTNIRGSIFPGSYGRVVIEIFKGNENVVYFLAHTPSYGKLGENHAGSTEKNSFWRYEYLGGDGTGDMGLWEDRTDNLPDLRQTEGYVWGDFLAQSGYNLICRVNPRNEDSILIGGTNIYASIDGFKTNENTTWIGGYKKTKDRVEAFFTGLVYPNHHPDQHNMLFHPEDVNVLYSANDGGIQVTQNCWAQDEDVVWENLSNGYYTTQFYTICMNQNPVEGHKMSDIMLGGFQDNETQYINVNGATDDPWTRIACCDGSYAGIFDKDDHTYVLTSKQLGTMYLYKFDKDGKDAGKQRVDPDYNASYLFINPYVHNPNKPEEIYLPAGNFIWRNTDLTGITLSGTDEKQLTNWTRMQEARSLRIITSIDCSTKPENIVYFGSAGGDMYRINDAHLDDNYSVTKLEGLTGSGYVSSIAIDPNDANSVLISFSNYNVRSLHYTNDGGTTWRDVSGNLEENPDGSGSGPSCNVVRIIRDQDNQPIYLVGTTVGLFSTTGLPGAATVWNQESPNQIGACSVRDIDYRSKDGLLLIGTHGCGSFSTQISAVASLPSSTEVTTTLYPNPTTQSVNYQWTKDQSVNTIRLIGMNGQQVKEWNNLPATGALDLESVKPGVYFVEILATSGSSRSKLILK